MQSDPLRRGNAHGASRPVTSPGKGIYNMGIFRYFYHEEGRRRDFGTFHEMREFAKDRTKNGSYHIHSPLRCCTYRREQIIAFGLSEMQMRELNIHDDRG